MFRSDIITTGLTSVSQELLGMAELAAKRRLLLSSRRWAEPLGHVGQDWDGVEGE